MNSNNYYLFIIHVNEQNKNQGKCLRLQWRIAGFTGRGPTPCNCLQFSKLHILKLNVLQAIRDDEIRALQSSRRAMDKRRETMFLHMLRISKKRSV